MTATTAANPDLFLKLAEAQNFTVAGVLAVVVVGLAIGLIWYAKNSVPKVVWEADQEWKRQTIDVLAKIAATVEVLASRGRS